MSEHRSSAIAALILAALVGLPTTWGSPAPATGGEASRGPGPGPDAPQTAADEAALGLTREDWRAVQRALADLGFDAGNDDGRPGPVTRAAVAAWQAGGRREGTGYLTGPQREAMLAEAQGGPAEAGYAARARFVRRVLVSAGDVWRDVFRAAGRTYEPPGLVLFSGSARSACDRGSSSDGGPFYCPADRDVYVDPAFFGEPMRRLGAAGEAARAYAVAHEVGHHVQNLLGITAEVDRHLEGADETQASRLSVLLELQASSSRAPRRSSSRPIRTCRTRSR